MIRKLATLANTYGPASAGAGPGAIRLGWIALLLVVTARVAGARGDPVDWALALALAFALLLTGMTIMTLDALRTGFGALDKFFQAALARSGRSVARPEPQPAPAPPPSRADHGYFGERPFTVHSDGTVTVDTLLGRRRFGSMHEARDFIGA